MQISKNRRLKFLFGVALTSILFGTAQIGTAQTQNAGVPLTIAEALESLEMDKNAKDFKFKTANITEEKAVFTDVSIFDNETNTKAKTVTLSRAPIDNKYTLTFNNLEILDGSMELTASNLSVVFDEKLKDMKRQIITKLADDEKGFSGDVKATNLVFKMDDDGQRVNVKSLAIDGFDCTEELRFDDLRLGGMSFKAAGMNFNLAKFELGGLSQFVFDKFNEDIEKYNRKTKGIDKNNHDDEDENITTGLVGEGLGFFEKAEIGKFLIEGVKVAPIPTKGKPSKKAQNSFDGFEIGRILLRNFDANHFDRFAIENVGFNAVAEGKPIVFKMGELSFDGLKFDLWKAMFKAYFMAPDDEESKKFLSTKLSDIAKRGPFDMTMDGFTFKNFLYSGLGSTAKIDNISYVFTKGANGMITDFKMPEGNIEVAVTDKKQTMGMLMAESFADLGMDKIKISFGGSAQYDPVSDTAKSDDFHVTFEKFFDFKMAYKSSNNLAWMKSTTIGQLVDYIRESVSYSEATGEEKEKIEAIKAEVLEAAAAADAEANGSLRKGVRSTDRGNNREISEGEKLAALQKAVEDAQGETEDTIKERSFAQMMIKQYSSPKLAALYKGLKYNYMKLSFVDLGMFQSLAAEQAIQDGISALKVRENWYNEVLKNDIGQSSGFLKELQMAIANLVKNGGKIEINLNNEKGVEFQDVWKKDADHKALGFSVSK